MKALCIRQPFASLIMDRYKDTEIRTWNLPQALIGEPILLCASGKPVTVCKGTKDEITFPAGVALGVIFFSGQREFTQKEARASNALYKPGQLAWEIDHERTGWIKPFPVSGKLKFFEVEDRLIQGSNDHYTKFFDRYTGVML